jgi:hypothetical protein
MKDKNKIPKGIYCDGCSYLRILPCLPDQENGYCEYLGQSDYEINRMDDDKDFEVSQGDTVRIMKGRDLPSSSLLWDGCKECGINSDFEEGDIV